MKKIVLIALCAFLSVVALAQNFDNGCECYSTHGINIEAVQMDAYPSDVLPVEMNVQYEMPMVDFYSLPEIIVLFDIQTSTIACYSRCTDLCSAMDNESYTDNLRQHPDFSRYRYHGLIIRAVHAA